jgi:oxygen-independent coproporphyrinogen-3 oxidase
MPGSESSSPRSAYVHVPFCRHRCGYCNFTLVAGRDDLAESYVEAIERELSWLGEPREVDTLYFGGGTPTHLSDPQLRRLLAAALRWFRPSDGYEFTVEANPADLDVAKSATLAEFGVNRVSLGGQSFQAGKLRLLERDHAPADIHRAIRLARQFAKSVSLDLIFGAPGESLEAWKHDLAAALEMDADHVACYGLTYERGTSFWTRRLRGELHPVHEEDERAMYETAIDTLADAGYEHYEVSNFARPGRRSRHNEAYWLGREYFAVGPGAARYVGGRREMNHRSTTTYLRRVLGGKSPVAESEQLEPEDAARERLVFGLRRMQGIDFADFAATTGFAVEELCGEAIERHTRLGFLRIDGGKLMLTRAGLLVSDALWPDFLRR